MIKSFFVFGLWLFVISMAYSQDDSTNVFFQPKGFIPIQNEDGVYFRNKEIKDTIITIHVDKFYPGISSDYGYYSKLNGKYGLISYYGDTIVPFDADTIFIGLRNIVTQKNETYEILGPLEIAGKRDKQVIQADSILLHRGWIYYYKQGKTGIADQYNVIPAEYQGISFLNCKNAKFGNHSEAYQSVFFKVITASGELQLINRENKPLLPKGVTEIQCYLYGYIMFYDTHYKYYNIFSNKFIDNNGHDVVIYDRDIYKCYNAERSKSIFYLEDRVFKNRFEDYFYLDNSSELAVRKNGKVGLLNINTNELVLPLEYDQVNYFERNNSIYYKTYKNQKCGVSGKGGKTIISHNYANVKSTPNDSLFIVVSGYQAGGVVNIKDQTVIPTEFPQIEVFKHEILVRKGSLFGLYNIQGKNIVPFRFNNVDSHRINGSTVFIFYEDSKKLFIANHNGYLGKQPVSHIEFGDGLIKTYSGNEVNVSVFNETGGLDETQTYTNLGIFEIQGGQRFYPERKWTWTHDELEENQLTGLYGRRKLDGIGFTFIPTYNTIRYSKFGTVYGVAQRPPRKMNVFQGVTATNQRYFDRIYSEPQKPLLMSDNVFIQTNVWSSTNEKYLMQDTSGNLSIANRINFDRSTYPPDGFVYALNKNFRGKFHLFSKNISVTRGEYDLSLTDYFTWMNTLGAFAPSIDELKRIYDPNLGVTFGNSTVMVSQAKHAADKDDNLRFEKPAFFKRCRELKRINALMYQELESNSYTIELFKKLKDEKYKSNQPKIENCKDAERIEGRIQNPILVTTNEHEKFKVHLDYPDFLYRSDSFFTSYDYGFLTLRISDSNYVLMRPDQSIIYDCKERIEHLSKNYFLIKERGEERSIIVNAKTRDTLFSEVEMISKFSDDLFIIEHNSKIRSEYTLIDEDVNEVRTFKHQVQPFQGDYIWKDYANKVALNLKNNITDTLDYSSYKLYDNGYLTYQIKSRSFIRLFGSNDSISIRSGIEFKPFGDKLYGTYGDRHLRIDSLLEEERYSRKTRINFFLDRFMIKNDGKTIVVFDLDDNELYSTEDVDIDFNEAINYVSFYENDELKFLTLEGQIIDDYKEALVQTYEDKKYRVTGRRGKYGLMINYDQALDNRFGSIQILNKKEIIVGSNGHQKIYDNELQFTGICAQQIFPLPDHNDYLIKNGQMIYTLSNDGIILDQSNYWSESWGIPSGR